MSNKTFTASISPNGQYVIITSREWEGVGKADYQQIAQLSHDEALSIGTKLIEYAQTVRENIHGNKLKQLEELKSKQKQLNTQVEMLEKEINRG